MATQSLDRPLPAATAGSRWAPLPIVLAGTFMVVLDFFIVNVALPSMQRQLHAGSGSVEWVVAGYSLASAVLLIAAGRLGDSYGRRRAFAAGLALFTLASALCGAATSPGLLVAGRIAQGAGGALLMPNVLALLSALYDGADRARALAAYGTVMGLAAASGQLIGGVLIAADPLGLGWRAVFAINVPIGAAALALAPRLLGGRDVDSRGGGDGRIDLGATALVTAAVTAIVLPLLEGRAHGWPLWTWLSFAAAPVLAAALVVQQRAVAARDGHERRMLLPTAALRTPGVRAGLVCQTAFWIGQASFFLVFGLYLQDGRAMSPLRSGLVFTILAVSYMATSMRAATLTARHGRRVLTAGMLVLAAGHGLLLGAVADVGVGGSVLALAPGLVLVGAGMGLGIAPLATIVLSRTRPEHAGAVSGALATAQNIGNAIGVAVIGVLFFGAAGAHGFGGAFELSVAVLAAVLIGVAGLTRALPQA